MANKLLVKKLDKVFSLYIRKRDSTDDEWFECCSCRKIKPYEQMDAGHWAGRRHMATRWNENNVHGQCRHCNRFCEGNPAGYALFMARVYGLDHMEYLESLSRTTVKFTDEDLKSKIEFYKSLLTNT